MYELDHCRHLPSPSATVGSVSSCSSLGVGWTFLPPSVCRYTPCNVFFHHRSPHYLVCCPIVFGACTFSSLRFVRFYASQPASAAVRLRLPSTLGLIQRTAGNVESNLPVLLVVRRFPMGVMYTCVDNGPGAARWVPERLYSLCIAYFQTEKLFSCNPLARHGEIYAGKGAHSCVKEREREILSLVLMGRAPLDLNVLSCRSSSTW
jgi:hypothetical protein